MFIYKIFIDCIKDVCYVGSTIDIEKRLYKHDSLLRGNKHFNFLLQEAYNNSVSKKITIEKLSETNKDDRYIDEYNEIVKQGKVYNLYINDSRKRFGDVIKNHPKREEIINKIKNTLIKNYVLMSDEDKQAKFARFGDKNPNWRGGISKSYCKCGKEKSLTAKVCGNCRDRSGNKNPFFGKTHSEETIKKIANANRGKIPVTAKPVMVNGIKYESATAAAKVLNCVTATVLNRIRAKKQGYSFIL
jgi:group I intron endonuclease